MSRTFAVLLLLLPLALGLSLVSGRGSLDLLPTLLALRGARTAVAFCVGASLAVGGVLVQGLFRNPLASPSVLGTTAGASLGGQIALLSASLVLGGTPAWAHPEMFLALGCVAGAAGSLLVLLLIHRLHRGLIVLLLAGFVLSSLFISIGSFLTSIAQEWWELGRALVSFSLGDIAGAGTRQLLLVAPMCALGVAFAVFWGHPLDVLLGGEEEARALGVQLDAVRTWTVAWTAILTAGAVAVGGNIGFVGLVVPHALRPFVGVRHRALTLASALGGGIFVVLCDALARVVSPRGEVPLGIVTGLIGAPVFLWLLLRMSRGGRLG